MSPVQTITGEAGVSLELIGPFRAAPELARGAVRLAALSDPWDQPDEFRPRMTVAVQAAQPQSATVVQLAALVIADELALGHHVAACDMWLGIDANEPEDRAAQQIIALYPAMDTTVIRLTYVTMRDDRAVTLVSEHGAEHHRVCLRVAQRALATLRCDTAGPPPAPDPATIPQLDRFAAERGSELEYLGAIRARQPFTSSGTTLGDGDLELLRRGKLGRRSDPGALRAGGFADDRGRLTDLGGAAHRALDAPFAQLSACRRNDGVAERAELRAYLRRDAAAVVTSGPSGSGAGWTLDVLPPRTVAVLVVRWLGLAPAWTHGIGEDSRSCLISTGLLDARLADAATPPPPDAVPALARVWSEPWEHVEIDTSGATGPGREIVMTTEAGPLLVEREPGSETASLAALPCFVLLDVVLGLCGFEVDSRVARRP